MVHYELRAVNFYYFLIDYSIIRLFIAIMQSGLSPKRFNLKCILLRSIMCSFFIALKSFLLSEGSLQTRMALSPWRMSLTA